MKFVKPSIKRIVKSSCLVLLLFSFINLSGQKNLEEANSTFQLLLEGHYDDIDSAVRVSDRLIRFYDDHELYCTEIKVLAQKARLLISSTEYEKSLQQILTAYKLNDRYGCDKDILPFLNLAYTDLYESMDDYETADSIIQFTIDAFQPGWSDTISLIKLYLSYGGGANSDIETIIEYVDTAYRLAQIIGDDRLQQSALIDLGATYANNGDMEIAKGYFEMALEPSRRRKDYHHLAVLYNNLAGLSDDLNQMKVYMDSARHYAELDHDLEMFQLLTLNMALVYKEMGDFRRAYGSMYDAYYYKDSLINIQRYEAIAEMEAKYDAEKRINEIQALKVENLNAELQQLRYKRNQNRLIIGSFILLGVAGFLGYSFFTIRRNRNILAGKNIELHRAQLRSDELLLNILPEEIAQELKDKGKAEAKMFRTASILFTDIIEFTSKTQKLETEEIVEELNYCFKSFDQIIDKYEVEKIKTIGDAYMAVGGLPIPSKDSVKNTVMAALEMQEFMKERKDFLDSRGRVSFEMRAGIHTGPVVAGIVGLRKFQYDIWGDSVNTAKRLETSGMAGKVNISDTTYELLKDEPDFEFESRGKQSIKGKGSMDMYFVRLRKAGS